MDIVISLGL
uniref:Uncharacterized protein n=1 Tax=Anguilla anguilla TaxID=7936 RepID=A0A0E9PHU6_ANGAN